MISRKATTATTASMATPDSTIDMALTVYALGQLEEIQTEALPSPVIP